MSTYLGVDGGGSKTRFLLIDDAGRILADHTGGGAYHLEIGMPALVSLLGEGVAAALKRGGVSAADLSFAFFGLPAYGEDRALLAELDAAPAPALPPGRFRCGNDMICGWAGALAGADGVNVVAGTGSIAYGEYAGRGARAGGWGELFSDEGSAHWLAREGLRLFSRMSDGRAPRGPLYGLVRRHFGLDDDLDLCAAIYGKDAAQRSRLAQLSRLLSEAAEAGDPAARTLFDQAARELVELVDAVRSNLGVPSSVELEVSGTGGLFGLGLLLAPFAAALAAGGRRYRLIPPRLSPAAGGALYAARLHGRPLSASAVAALAHAAAAPVAA